MGVPVLSLNGGQGSAVQKSLAAAACVALAAAVLALSQESQHTLFGLLAEKMSGRNRARFQHGSDTHEINENTVYDVVIVLGYRVLADGELSSLLKNRVEAGVHMMASGKANHIIFSGSHDGSGSGSGRESEAQSMYNHAVNLSDRMFGVHTRRELQRFWIIEDKSTSTRENAKFSIEICRKKKLSKLAIVTNRFHLLRSLLSFRKAIAELQKPLALSTNQMKASQEDSGRKGYHDAAVSMNVTIGDVTRNNDLLPSDVNGIIESQLLLLREIAALVYYYWKGFL